MSKRPRGKKADTPASAPGDDHGQLSVRIPLYVLEQVHERAKKPNTLRTVVLRALRADGFKVNEGDLVDRRAEARRLQAELYRQHKARLVKPK